MLNELRQWLQEKIDFHQDQADRALEAEKDAGTERYYSCGQYQRVVGYKDVLRQIDRFDKDSRNSLSGEIRAMKLSGLLMDWADEIGMHDPDNPCYCDVCQRLVPAAIESEKYEEKRLEAIYAWLKTLPDKYMSAGWFVVSMARGYERHLVKLPENKNE